MVCYLIHVLIFSILTWTCNLRLIFTFYEIVLFQTFWMVNLLVLFFCWRLLIIVNFFHKHSFDFFTHRVPKRSHLLWGFVSFFEYFFHIITHRMYIFQFLSLSFQIYIDIIANFLHLVTVLENGLEFFIRCLLQLYLFIL